MLVSCSDFHASIRSVPGAPSKLTGHGAGEGRWTDCTVTAGPRGNSDHHPVQDLQAGELCEDRKGTKSCADVAEAGDRRGCWRLSRRCDRAAAHLCVGLRAALRTVQVSRFLTPLVHAVIFTVTPLDHRWVLGRLGSIRDIQLHDHHTWSRR